jgi:hypothetical protein
MTDIPFDSITPDTVVHIYRQPPGGAWVKDFVGIHRKPTVSTDGDMLLFTTEGFDLKSLLKTRCILPDTTPARVHTNAAGTLWQYTGPWCNLLRQLVYDQAVLGIGATDSSRVIPYLTVEGMGYEGETLTLNYRYDNLADIIMETTGLGGDWDVVEVSPGTYEFRLYYPRSGVDRTPGNEDGTTPLVFSLENQNMLNPVYTDDRTAEITVAFAVGQAVKGIRPIFERHNLYNAEHASEWNRREAVVDSSTYDTMAACLASGDGYLADNGRKVSLTFDARQTPNCLYGVHWDLGDMVGSSFVKKYDMRITEVSVSIDASGETIVPTIVRLPSLEEG